MPQAWLHAKVVLDVSEASVVFLLDLYAPSLRPPGAALPTRVDRHQAPVNSSTDHDFAVL